MPEPAAPALDALQRWLRALITHPVDAATAAGEIGGRWVDPQHVAAVVRPSPRLEPLERVQIYASMYFIRLLEAVAEDYPGLRHFVGEDGFAALIRRYLTVHPSRHQNLIFLGRDLPAFVTEDPATAGQPFLADLAQLEWSLTEAFHAPEFDPADFQRLQDQGVDWAAARFALNPSVRLLALGWKVVPLLDELREGGDPRPPARPEAEKVVVYRFADRVFRVAVPPAIFASLEAIAAGEPLGDALAAPGVEEADVGTWFQRWSAHGLLTDAPAA